MKYKALDKMFFVMYGMSSISCRTPEALKDCGGEVTEASLRPAGQKDPGARPSDWIPLRFYRKSYFVKCISCCTVHLVRCSSAFECLFKVIDQKHQHYCPSIPSSSS